MSEAILSSFDDWQTLASLYGIHIVVGVCLSAVTIYRREMSCNRVFHQDDEDAEEFTAESTSTDDSLISDALEEETEELLEGAGMYCSGAPIFSLASLWLDSFPAEEDLMESPVPLKLLQTDVTPTDLLDRAGNFCSGEPLLAAMALFLFEKTRADTIPSGDSVAQHYDPFTKELPPDIHVHISSFLHPKDVVSLSCVSKSYRAVVDDSETALAIWRTLWRRDYAWILEEWSVGQEALQRSNPRSMVVDKEVYFSFGASYMNYLLAGQNTAERCLVGLHSDIYDITPFLDTHPGSPDTLLVHSGKDATRFFEDMGHSHSARRTAQKLCVVTDLSHSNDGWGFRPTPFTQLSNESAVPPRLLEAGTNPQLGRKQKAKGGTLFRIQKKLTEELAQVERQMSKRYGADSSVLGQVNPYYDPFLKEWRVWYTNDQLQTIFAPI